MSWIAVSFGKASLVLFIIMAASHWLLMFFMLCCVIKIMQGSHPSYECSLLCLEPIFLKKKLAETLVQCDDLKMKLEESKDAFQQAYQVASIATERYEMGSGNNDRLIQMILRLKKEFLDSRRVIARYQFAIARAEKFSAGMTVVLKWIFDQERGIKPATTQQQFRRAIQRRFDNIHR